MPTVWTQGKLRIVIRTKDHNPPHVHVILGNNEASIEIKTLRVTANNGFSKADLNAAAKIIAEQTDEFLEQWESYHGKEK